MYSPTFFERDPMQTRDCHKEFHLASRAGTQSRVMREAVHNSAYADFKAKEGVDIKKLINDVKVALRKGTKVPDTSHVISFYDPRLTAKPVKKDENQLVEDNSMCPAPRMGSSS